MGMEVNARKEWGKKKQKEGRRWEGEKKGWKKEVEWVVSTLEG
jgi:hypothetical protein